MDSLASSTGGKRKRTQANGKRKQRRTERATRTIRPPESSASVAAAVELTSAARHPNGGVVALPPSPVVRQTPAAAPRADVDVEVVSVSEGAPRSFTERRTLPPPVIRSCPYSSAGHPGAAPFPSTASLEVVDLTDESAMAAGPSGAAEVIDVESREWHPPVHTPFHMSSPFWSPAFPRYSDSDSEDSEIDDYYRFENSINRQLGPPIFSNLLPLFIALSSRLHRPPGGPNGDDYEFLLSLDGGATARMRPASVSQISKNPIRKLRKNEHNEKCCCICLCDMEAGERVRTLPCSHYFHVKCIDQWLKVNKVCPVDKKPIDTP